MFAADAAGLWVFNSLLTSRSEWSAGLVVRRRIGRGSRRLWCGRDAGEEKIWTHETAPPKSTVGCNPADKTHE